MNERYQEVLEQYEVETLSVRKGRGAWICETDKGLKLLREYRGTVRRLEFEDQVLECLDTRGSLRADQYVRNQEGALLSKAGDGTGYIMKEWFSDRECNIRDSYEIRQGISRLAMLHGQLRQKRRMEYGVDLYRKPGKRAGTPCKGNEACQEFYPGQTGKNRI